MSRSSRTSPRTTPCCHVGHGNALFHEIIALEPNTAVPVKVQIAALTELAERYIERRAPRQLAVGVIHADTAHVHMHLMISSNAVLSKRRLWLAKKDFAAIQREIEAYRLERFPELGTARHYAEAGRGIKRGHREQAAALRTGTPTRKQVIAAEIEAAMKKAKDREDLTATLASLGLTLYRRGRTVGVVSEGGRRHRLATLGLAEAYTEAEARFDLFESRMAMLERGHSREREHERQ